MRPVYVIGHKNPDTDSICSAIAYARLKCQVTGGDYQPRRAGRINEETAYVLDRFGVEPPPLIETLEPRAMDVQMSRAPGISAEVSLLRAWEQMQRENIHTLAILKNRHLQGIVTLGDIARSYMQDLECTTLAQAGTSYQNIVETLSGDLLVGEASARFTQGKVVVSAANPDIMEHFIEAGDLVILGNRYEAQLSAIEIGAGCIVVCLGAPVSRSIRRLAGQRGCTVIVTPYDTYTVSRLINQAIPVRHVMRTEGIVTFDEDDYVSEMKTVMARRRFRNFPILDNDGNYVGLVTQRHLLDMPPQQVILVDHNERAQAVDGVTSAEILEIIDHHRLGNIETMQPVFFRNQPLGCTATILTQMYREQGVEPDRQTAALLLSAILSDTLMFRSPTCTLADQEAARALARRAEVELEELALAMFRAGSRLVGKSEEEIFFADFKTFTYDGLDIGIGQVSSVSPEELEELEGRIYPYMLQVQEGRKLDMVMFMLTNILDESTNLLFAGAATQAIVERAFGQRVQGHQVCLPGVLSRKKQMVPAVMSAIQRMSE